MILDEDVFIETVLPKSILRTLNTEEMEALPRPGSLAADPAVAARAADRRRREILRHEVAMQSAKGMLIETPRAWQAGFAIVPLKTEHNDDSISRAARTSLCSISAANNTA